MRHLNDVIFIDNLPSIDLHGYDRETARVAINDFINDNYKQKNNIFCIVHGIGSGTLRIATNETLKKNKKVVDYKTFYYNQGCTVVEINID
jgi:dsDNA-specific endonuclease/ATPase MutS2